MTLKTTVAALLLAGLTGLSPAGQEQTRRLYVSALDSSEVAVANLGPDDLTVKEGGKLRPILRVEPAVAKMSIAILVDDNGTGIFRFGVGRFIQSLLGRAEFSISVVRGQSMKLVDFTDDTRELSEAVAQLTAHPSTNDGNQLLDGITGSSLDMAKRKAGRPIIIALTVGGDDVTPMQPDDALEDLRKSGAQLYVVSMFSSSLRPVAPKTRASDVLEGHALGAVLGDGPARSGGYREDISAMAGVDPRLARLADQLKQQFMVEYSLQGSKPSKTVTVTMKRKDVTLRAPTHVPDKF